MKHWTFHFPNKFGTRMSIIEITFIRMFQSPVPVVPMAVEEEESQQGGKLRNCALHMSALNVY